MRRLFPIILCLTGLLLSGCVQELVFGGGRCVSITVACEDPVLTKAEGDDNYNENRISWVDFFFYPLASGKDLPDEDQSATLHIRKDLGASPAQGSYQFKLDVRLDEVDRMFAGETRYVYVFAVANYFNSNATENANILVPDEENLPTLADLHAIKAYADFAAPKNHKQTRFMMSGSQKLELISREKYQVAIGTIQLKRYAAKITVNLHVNEAGVEVEGAKWYPMLDGMEAYLYDGVNSVCLSETGRDADPRHFNYGSNRLKYATLDNNTGAYIPSYDPVVQSGKTYYRSDPMYMYPQIWDYGCEAGYKMEPYLKVIVPWYRLDEGTVSFAQRQCYYKVMMPFVPDPASPDYQGVFERNNWYHLDLDIDILGALTEDNAVLLQPATCYIGTWLNANDPRIHLADVGTARYLSVERDSIVIRNIPSVDAFYVSSHPADFYGVRATRRYYGTKSAGEPLKKDDYTVMVREAGDNDIYPKGAKYLEYMNAPGTSTQACWLTKETDGTKTLIRLTHELNNNYKDSEFDYSPYTISFTLKHEDRAPGQGIEQTVTITQYPAIYIDALTNSDADYVGGTTQFKEGSNQIKSYKASTYWGYVFVDGGAYKSDNWDPDPNNPYSDSQYYESDKCKWVIGYRQARTGGWSDKKEMLFKLVDSDPANQTLMRKEYQWRAVSYTGGSLDMFQINVSVLLNSAEFVIGDPRTTIVDNLDYEFVSPNPDILPSRLKEDGADNAFEVGPSLDKNASGDFLDNSRRLTYYYPTESSDRTKTMLAPSYRISSKFGGVEFAGVGTYGVPDVEQKYAKYRCATYQEDGFPAGRWRLPTKGEIKFIAQLSANGVFATLFTNGQSYWSANGPIKINGKNVEEPAVTTALLRCVYDTWYWGEDQEEYDAWSAWKYGSKEAQGAEFRNHFVWGDQPRQ